MNYVVVVITFIFLRIVNCDHWLPLALLDVYMCGTEVVVERFVALDPLALSQGHCIALHRVYQHILQIEFNFLI